MNTFLEAALDEARFGFEKEGGIPIGSVLVRNDEIIGRGHNLRIQKKSVVLHAEMAALEDAGRLGAHAYRECTIYTTLSPCPMCSGAIRLYGIPRVVIGENRTFLGDEDLLRNQGVEVQYGPREIADECYGLLERFRKERWREWNEDIGVISRDAVE